MILLFISPYGIRKGIHEVSPYTGGRARGTAPTAYGRGYTKKDIHQSLKANYTYDTKILAHHDDAGYGGQHDGTEKEKPGTEGDERGVLPD